MVDEERGDTELLFALLGFLCAQPLKLCGLNVQALSTPARRAMHEIAFTPQRMIQAEMSLLLHGLDPMPTALLLPPDLCTRASAALADPGRIQVTESAFLERASAVQRGLTVWLGDQSGQVDPEQAAEGGGARRPDERSGLQDALDGPPAGAREARASGDSAPETGDSELRDVSRTKRMSAQAGSAIAARIRRRFFLP